MRKKTGSPENLVKRYRRKLNQWMRAFYILFFSIATLGLNAQNVKVNVDTNGKTLERVLPEITKQTGLQFLYELDILKIKVHVDEVKMEGSAKQILDRLFSDTGVAYSITDNRVYLSIKDTPSSIYKQQFRTIQGTVILSEDMEPAIGATITITDFNIGSITDVNGKFILQNVPATAQTLTVSYIGMRTVVVAIKNNLKIILEPDAQVLDEILVVAFGEMKRSSFTGSAGVINADAISNRQVTSVMNALEGKVAGVQMIQPSGGEPGAAPEFRIRGISSITASKSPLIVLDGIPYDGGWNEINPNDVESITVLKDAASNALYGARGANGVIMITTKKAAPGDAKITVDMKWGFNNRVDDSYEYIKDPRQYYELHYKALHNYYMDMDNSSWAAHVKANEAIPKSKINNGVGYLIYNVPEGEYLIGSDGRFNPNSTLGNIIEYKGVKYTIAPDNWIDEIYKTGIRQEYNVSMNGGNDKTQMYVSFGYLNNQGIIRGSDYERYTARLKAAYQIKKWVKVGGNAAFSSSERNVADDYIYSSLQAMAPIYPVYIRDEFGNIMHDENGKMYDYGEGAVIGLERPQFTMTNPLQTSDMDTNNTNLISFNGSGFVDVYLMEGLKFTYNAGVTNQDYRTTFTSQPFYGYVTAGGTVSKYHNRDFTFNHQQLLNYTKSFGNHNIAALLGHEYYKRRNYRLNASKSNLFSYFENQELAGATKERSSNSYITPYQTEGYFTRVMYDYKSKYFFSGSYRRDASSRFAPEHKWGNFWSLSGAWMLHKENWFNMSWIDVLKYKISYGSQGNDGIGNFRYEDSYSLSSSGDGFSIVFDNKGKRDITWETNGNLNTGVEFSFFKSRLEGEVEFFYRKTTDMLTKISLPYSTGYGSYYDNIGDMVNKGVEITLSGDIIRNRDLVWSVNVNATHYKNKITKLAAERKMGTPVDGIEGYNSGSYFYGEGRSMYTWRLRKFMGINEEGRATYLRVDPDTGEKSIVTNSSQATYHLCGNALPDVYGGFGTTVKFRGFDLSATFTYSIGGKVYDNGYAGSIGAPSPSSAGYNFHKDVLKAWTPENTSANIARWYFNDSYSTSASDRFLMDGSWLNFTNMSFGYTVPKKLISKLDISRLRIHFTCDNIAFWSKRKGLNSSRTWDGDAPKSGYSPVRSISGGINIQF